MPTSPEDLDGMMFSAIRPATFNKTVKRILGYATLKHGHYTGRAVQTCQLNILNRPIKPSD